jgi:type I restriction enzyme, S subunit
MIAMKQTPLSQLALISAGQSAPKDNEFSKSGVPFVRAGSLEALLSGKSESELELVSAETSKLRKLKTYPKGTILFAKSGMSATKDRVYVLQNSAHVVSHLATLIPKDAAHVDYLRLALKRFPPSSLIKDPAYPAIGLGEIERFEIPVPEGFDDQIRIAHLLGKVEGLIAQRKQHLKQLDDLLKSVFLEMFGDPIINPHKFEVRRLSEFYINPKDGTKCGPFGSALKKQEFVDYGVPVWNMDNISTNGKMIRPFRMWITNDKYDALKSYSVQDGDIIISRAGTVGKMCVAYMHEQPAIISTNLIRLRLGPDLNPLHFVSLMLYCKGRLGRLKIGADGAFTHMSTKVLDSLEFPYPPVKLQNHFASIEEKVHNIKTHYKQNLYDLEDVYKALNQKAFKGELDLSRIPLPEDTNNHIPTEEDGQLDMPAFLRKSIALVTPSEVVSFLAQNKLPDDRRALITQWFEYYLADTSPDISLGSAQLLESTWQVLQNERFEIDGETPAITMDDYDMLKDLVFEALNTGRLIQSQNQDHCLIATKEIVYGNCIELKSGAQS